MRRTTLVLVALSALIAAPVQADPVVLAPGSKWNVDFDRNKCRLIRFFGPEAERNVLILEQYFPGQQFSMTVSGPAFAKIERTKANTVRFIADRPPTKQEPLIGPLEGYGRSLYFMAVGLVGPDKPNAETAADTGPKAPAMLDPALAAQVEYVDVTDSDEQVRLMTGPLDRPVKVMNECLLDLIGSWGLDPDQHRTATRLPHMLKEQATMTKLFSRIPWSRLGNSGGLAALRIRLITKADGQVESCTLVENTDTKLEADTCKGLAKARFDPALDAEGRPMRSYHMISVVATTFTRVQSISL